MDIPFEFVSQITGAGPMAKASHVERCSAASRHCGTCNVSSRLRNAPVQLDSARLG